jgi:hypothetical protein
MINNSDIGARTSVLGKASIAHQRRAELLPIPPICRQWRELDDYVGMPFHIVSWLVSFSRGAFRAPEAVGLVPFEGLFED